MSLESGSQIHRRNVEAPEKPPSRHVCRQQDHSSTPQAEMQTWSVCELRRPSTQQLLSIFLLKLHFLCVPTLQSVLFSILSATLHDRVWDFFKTLPIFLALGSLNLKLWLDTLLLVRCVRVRVASTNSGIVYDMKQPCTITTYHEWTTSKRF